METRDKCKNGWVSSYPVQFNQSLTQFKVKHLPDHKSQASRDCSLPNAGPTEAGL